MFNIGDAIIYGAQGICKIDCIQTKQIGKTAQDYYVLKPVFNDNTAVFVPIDNKLLTSRMQSILTKTQAEELVKKISKIESFETKDENDKRERYKLVLSGGNREEIISLIKTIRNDRDTRRQNNKKLNINDEQTLRKAELLLYNELAFVYGVQPEEVKNIIKF